MGRRKVACHSGGFYHVFNKSIAGFEIFRYREEYLRMQRMVRFYLDALSGYSYSNALKRSLGADDPEIHGALRIRLIAYCLMPTHVHFLALQMSDDGIEEFMRHLEAGYSMYLNKKTGRKGPLWEGRYGARLVEQDGDLLHLTRYIHLNPTSAGLVKRPEDWEFSSYHEYLGTAKGEPLCDFKKLIPMPPANYHKFVEDRAGYQKSLQVIKSHLMD